MPVHTLPASLENVVLRAPSNLRLLPNLFAQAITGPPMTTAKHLTCVVELKSEGRHKGPASEFTFDVVAYRVRHDVPLASAPSIVKRVTLSPKKATETLRFEFSNIEDDGRFAYVVVVDSNNEVLESNEGLEHPGSAEYDAGNVVITYGPNW